MKFKKFHILTFFSAFAIKPFSYVMPPDGGGGGDGGSVSGYVLSVSGDCTASGLQNYFYQCENSSGVKSSYAPTLEMALGGNGASATWWAWGYAILRILHSLWQCLVNTVPVRFMLFTASNVCLFVLAYYAVRLTF